MCVSGGHRINHRSIGKKEAERQIQAALAGGEREDAPGQVMSQMSFLIVGKGNSGCQSPVA